MRVTTSDMRLYRLMHLADSVLPSGGYAFSNGLEGAYQLGMVTSSETYREYLHSVMGTTAQCELPFIHSCFLLGNQNGRAHIDYDELHSILDYYDALVTAPATYRASINLGKNWLRLMKGLYPDKRIEELNDWFGDNKIPPHYTVVFGSTLMLTDFAEPDARQLFMYQFIRDQISAAIRLGIIGSLEGAQLQKQQYDACGSVVSEYVGLTYLQATRGAPQWEISQSIHERLFSRMFQS